MRSRKKKYKGNMQGPDFLGEETKPGLHSIKIAVFSFNIS